MPERFLNIDSHLVTPEMKLLIQCVNPESQENHTKEDKALLAEISNWNHLLDLAEQHRVTPLLHSLLVARHGAPRDVMATLRKANLANVTRNSFMTNALLKVLDVLSSNKIQAIPIKGPTLAVMAYGDISMRQFDDLDFVLPGGSIHKAASLLISAGYKARLDMSNTQREAHIKAGWGYSMISPDGSFFLELDSGIAAKHFAFDISLRETLDDLTEVAINQKTIKTVSRERLLLLLCAHGTKHLWERLSWIADVARLIQASPQLDWKRLVELSKNLGAQRMLLLGIALADSVSPIDIPPDLREAINNDRTMQSLAKITMKYLAAGTEPPDEQIMNISYHIKARERIRDRLRYGLGLMLTPSMGDFSSMRLPSSLFPIYYITRPFRLACKIIARNG